MRNETGGNVNRLGSLNYFVYKKTNGKEKLDEKRDTIYCSYAI